MQKKSLSDIAVNGKRVIMRVDFNVPLDDHKKITDDKRIFESLPSINKVLSDGGRLILMSHLGRPKGKVNPDFSLAPVALRLAELLDRPVIMAEECVGSEVKKQVSDLKDGEVILLENLRFHPEEEANDPDFAKALAELGDVYVNDAFGTAHRAHASTEGITHFIKTAVAGYLIKKELLYLGKALHQPERPFVAILGGSKISGKIDVLENIFKAQGYQVGKSLVEESKVELALKILEEAKNKGIKLLLPLDVILAAEISADAPFHAADISSIPENMIGVDIGPVTIETYRNEILSARTVLWNGPMGVFEIDNFAEGTLSVAKALSDATAKGATTIVGGGDSAAAIAKAGLSDEITHISTGGGASLEFLEGKELPGIAALND